jgi:hypothetical protein
MMRAVAELLRHDKSRILQFSVQDRKGLNAESAEKNERILRFLRSTFSAGLHTESEESVKEPAPR